MSLAEFTLVQAVAFYPVCQLTVSVDEAATENVADCPAVTVWLAGCVVIDSVTTAALTVSAAALLVTLLALLLTTTVNCAPLSAVVVAGVMSDDDTSELLSVTHFRR